MILFCDIGSARQENRTSNLTMLQNCYTDIINSVLPTTMLPETQPLFIKGAADHAVHWLIEEQFFQWAKRNGFDPIVKNPSIRSQSGSRFFTIEFKPIACSVRYQKLSGAFDSSVMRTIRAELYIHYSGPDDTLLASRTMSHTKQDTILVKEIKDVENVRYDFTMGEKPQSLFSIVLEPLMVSIVTGTIIYFFFSFRSK